MQQHEPFSEPPPCCGEEFVWVPPQKVVEPMDGDFVLVDQAMGASQIVSKPRRSLMRWVRLPAGVALAYMRCSTPGACMFIASRACEWYIPYCHSLVAWALLHGISLVIDYDINIDTCKKVWRIGKEIIRVFHGPYPF